MIRLFKGYFISSTYAKVISNQSCITNCGTPCMYRLPVASRVFPIPGIFQGPATYYLELKPRNRKRDPRGYTINGPVGPEAPISTQFLPKKDQIGWYKIKGDVSCDHRVSQV